MNARKLNVSDSERQTLLGQLNAAESALRANLHKNGIDLITRAHMERALAHIHEAYVAINEVGRARTVQQLVHELMKVERLAEKVRQQAPRVVTKPIRI